MKSSEALREEETCISHIKDEEEITEHNLEKAFSLNALRREEYEMLEKCSNGLII